MRSNTAHGRVCLVPRRAPGKTLASVFACVILFREGTLVGDGPG